MKIVSAAEMRDIDRITSERFGVPSLTLMENAGTSIAEVILTQYSKAHRISVICGKGNNAGDGFVVGRKLCDAGKEVSVFVLANPEELRGDASAMFQKLAIKSQIIQVAEDLQQIRERQPDLIVDALLGSGFHPPVTGLYAAAISAMNATETPTVAIDIPSGADADVMGDQTGTVARADAIVTFTAPRPAHVFGQLTVGPIVVAPIGSPEEAITSSLDLRVITSHDVAALIGPRLPDSNKGNFGHVLVIGGSVGKAGAAAMAGMSVLRSGAGLSTVATAKSVLATVAGFHSELMTEPLEETEAGSIAMAALEYGRLDRLTEGKSVLAIGPGISRQTETSQFVRTIVNKYSVPMVLDADGLNAFEERARELNGSGKNLVITPHPGEMARLTGLSTTAVQHDRMNVARAFAREHACAVVLKGHRTLIAQPDGTIWVNMTGNPGMATGGTGDILTGMVAGFVAQYPERVHEAVAAAVYLHGLAGDVAIESTGQQAMVATDLLKALPEAMRRTRESAKQSYAQLQG